MKLVKYKNYFDGYIKLSFIIKERGNFGILFRVTDSFNFYAVVFDYK